MKTLNFRAWDNIDKKMYPYAIKGFNGELHVHKNAKHNGEWINIGCGREDGEVDYYNNMLQFIGLFDQDGKEIYEGDIIIYTNDGASTNPYIIPEVDPDNWEDLLNVMSSEFNMGNNKYSNIKVIGNKFENPELITLTN